MANTASQKLAQQIWAIANKLRGNMDASKFKDYILGVIFIVIFLLMRKAI